MPSSHFVPNGQGLTTDKGDLTKVLQQIQHSHNTLYTEYQQQNIWTKRWVLLAAILVVIMIAAGAIVGYRFYSNNTIDQEFSYRLEKVKEENNVALLRQLADYEKKYREDMSHLRGEERKNYEKLLDFLVKLQLQQRASRVEYEDKVLKLEQEKLVLNNNNQEIRKSWTDAEIELRKVKNELAELKKQVKALEKEKKDYQRQLLHWRKIAAEKFSPQQWKTLQQDLEDDN